MPDDTAKLAWAVPHNLAWVFESNDGDDNVLQHKHHFSLVAGKEFVALASVLCQVE